MGQPRAGKVAVSQRLLLVVDMVALWAGPYSFRTSVRTAGRGRVSGVGQPEVKRATQFEDRISAQLEWQPTE